MGVVEKMTQDLGKTFSLPIFMCVHRIPSLKLFQTRFQTVTSNM